MTTTRPASGLEHRHRLRAGLTLIEILVVVTIIAVLAGLALPAISLVRNRSRIAGTASTIATLTIALDTYAEEEDRHRFPLQELLFITSAPAAYEISKAPVTGYAQGLAGLLIDRQLLPLGAITFGADGRMLDPWGQAFRYQLKRPAPAGNAGRLVDWNWDAAQAREFRWDQARNQASPYPYLYALGPAGNADDATAWIYHAR